MRDKLGESIYFDNIFLQKLAADGHFRIVAERTTY